MKVTVSKFLNVRVGKPDVNADCYQYLAPGSTIEVEDTLYEGGDFRGNTKWFRDKFNNYYWSGGIEPTDNSLHQLQSKIENPFLFYKGNGANVGIGIFDSGINNKHRFLKGRVKFYENFIQGANLSEIHNHGHNVSSVIVSDDLNIKKKSIRFILLQGNLEV